jgi:hypothetical protein
MKITLLNRMVHWVTARSMRAALSHTGRPGTLNPTQMKRLLMRLHDLEWQVRGLTEQCSTLQETASVHDWSLAALWEKVYEPRPLASTAGAPDPGPPKKKTLN